MPADNPKVTPKEPPPEEDVGGHGAAPEADRGRFAEAPTELPAKGWKDILLRTKQQMEEDNLSIVAAGIAFYAFLAFVPALVVVIAIYALVADASDIQRHLDLITRVAPGEIAPLIEDQLKRIAIDNDTAGLSAVFGLLVAWYSSANATKALINGLNIAYDEVEKRKFFKLNLVALALTLGAVLSAILVLGIVAVLPAVFSRIGLSGASEAVLNWLRWPIVLGVFSAGISILYRYGPNRDAAKWKWISGGTAVASLLWVMASVMFSLYVTKFGSYDKTYGSLGAVVVFLMWLYLSAYVILIGAEVNSEMERQTVKDTTTGPPKNLGERGAYAADTVGPAKGK